MKTYKYLLRLTEDDKAKLFKLQKRLSRRTGTKFSINQTIETLINKESENNDKQENE